MHVHYILILRVLCVSPSLCGGGPAGQREAGPEGVHQEDFVPGQPAALSAEDPQPGERRPLVP